MFASFLFILFASLALSWKIVIPVGIIASVVPMIFLNPIYGLILMVGILASLLLIYVFLETSMESYITFNANALLGPQIKNLYAFLILLISFIVFLSINKSVPSTGFQISESLLTKSQTISTSNSQLPISNEQIDLLKQKNNKRNNPQLLKQFGLDPAILDNLTSSQSNMTNQLINQTVIDQIQGFVSTLNPYIRFVPAALAALLFLNLLSAIFILNFFLHPLLW
ncbi:hypothetical protein M1437_03520, partial [Patescibacteria group bacterium]|nr:hypothetical protein [Patescibacteria group bacterium]